MQTPSPARQPVIKELFLACISASDEEREILLSRATDVEVANQVRALLHLAGQRSPVDSLLVPQAYEELDVTCDSNPRDLDGPDQSKSSQSDQPGKMIGNYKLLEQIGEGGMGSVYMAMQYQPIKRKVALKLIKPGMDTGQVVARFEAERQALALMDHPNIARVLDAGTTSLGRPFFVMELVRGITITDFCKSKKLSLEDRLKLFVDVCSGVQHAHQRGIIHRDLKPGNLLVTLHDGEPVVKIIDFGIAKATNQELTDKTLFTNFAQLIGTPLYMSPEQAEMSGLDIDTRSDVYSLGVVLYELLTGSTPFDRESLKKVGIDEIRRIICETDPVRPSMQISTLKFQADLTLPEKSELERRFVQLRGELDWIVMKSLEKDRNRRYESASAFAADIRRYLNDEPVEACPPSLRYRFGKFARRHRASLTTAVGLMLIFLLAGSTSIWLAIDATRARKRADDNALKSSEQERLAKDQEAKANASAEAERVAREQAQQSEQLAKDQLYFADIRLGNLDIVSRNTTRLWEKLISHVPRHGTVDKRGWEWYYLLAQCASFDKVLFDSVGSVTSVQWSPNGKLLAVGTMEGEVRLISADKQDDFLFAHESKVPCRSVDWSADGQFLCWGTAGEEETSHSQRPYIRRNAVFVMDVKSKALRHFAGSAGSVTATAWHPHGDLIASTGMDRTIRIWSHLSGRQTRSFGSIETYATHLDWHPNGRWIVLNSNARDDARIVWDVETGTLLPDSPSVENVSCASFSKDGTTLFVGRGNGECRIYSVADWRLLQSWQGHRSRVSSCDWLTDSGGLITGGDDQSVCIWNPNSGTLLRELRGSEGAVKWLSISPDNRELASADKFVRTWDMLSNPAYRIVDSGLEVAPELRWLNDEDMAIVGHDATYQLHHSELRRLSTSESTRLIDVNADASKRVVHKMSEGTSVLVLAAKSGGEEKEQVLTTIDPSVSTRIYRHLAAFSEDGKYLAICVPIRAPQIYSFKLFDLSTGTAVCKYESEMEGPYKLAFSKHSRFCAVSGQFEKFWINQGNGGLRIFELADLNWVPSIRHGHFANAISWNSDETQIVVGDQAGAVAVWNVLDQKPEMRKQMHSTSIESIAWSPDDRRVASLSGDGVLRVWEPNDGNELLMIDLQSAAGGQLQWSNDGQCLACSTSDGKIHIWSASRGMHYASSELFDWMRIADGLHQSIALWQYGRVEQSRQMANKVLDIPKHAAESVPRQLMIDWYRHLDDVKDRQLLQLTAQAIPIKQVAFVCARNDALDLAVQILRACIKSRPDAREELQALAWYLGTTRDDKVKSPHEALDYAKRAFELQAPKARQTLGACYYAAGDYTAARRVLEEQVQLESDGDHYDWLFLALTYCKLGEQTKAELWLMKAVDFRHKLPPTNEYHARLDEARAMIVGTIDPEKEATRIRLHKQLIDAYTKANKPEIERLTAEYLEKSPRSQLLVRQWLVHELIAQRRWEDASKELEKNLALFDKSVYTNLNLAICYSNLQRYEDAKKLIERTMELSLSNPDDMPILAELIDKVYGQLKQQEQAATQLRRILSLHPNCGGAWGALGNIERDAKRLDSALECYAKAIQQSDKQLAQWYVNTATIRNEKGEEKEFRQALEDAFRYAPRLHSTALLARSMAIKGDARALDTLCESVLSIYDAESTRINDDFRTTVFKVLAESEQKKYLERALLVLEQHEDENNKLALLATKGTVLFRLERYADALACLIDASRRSEESTPYELHLYLACVHFHRDNRKQAIEELLKAEERMIETSAKLAPTEWQTHASMAKLKKEAHNIIKPTEQELNSRTGR